jgi:ribose transport system substrate-binding protein
MSNALSPTLRLLFLSLVAAIAVTGCKGSKKDANKGIKVGLVLARTDTPYYQALRRGAEGYATRQNFSLVVEDAGGKSSEQTRLIEQLIQQRVNAVAIDPIEPARLTAVVKKALDAGLFVSTIHRDIPGTDVSALVEVNDELAGKLAADYLGVEMKGGGAVGILKLKGAPGGEKRALAFKKHLKGELHGFTIAGEETATGLDDTPAAMMRLLRRNPVAIFTATDEQALAILPELTSLTKKPKILSFGGDKAAIEELKKPDSPLVLTVAPLPQIVGNFGVRLAFRKVMNQPATAHAEAPVYPITRDSLATFPGWEDDTLPKEIEMPWASDLTLKVEHNKQ